MVNERLLDTPFDQYQRYRATEEIIRIIKKETGKKRLRILDVGGYFKNSQGQDTLPLKEFLPEEDIFVLDMVECHLPHYIQGDATATPFPQKTFDVLVCQDVLEHIPPKDRETFLKNLLQLVKSFVVLGAPFKTENTVLAEKILYEYIWRTLKGRHRELEEHIQNGLPDTKDMESFLKGKRLSYCDFPSGYLNNWLLLMMVKHYLLELPDSQDLLALIDRFYNKNFYESDQRPPAYRHMFVISKTEKDLHILEKISGKFRHYREKYKHLTLEKSDFSHLQTLLSLDALRDRNTIEGLNSQILNHRKHIQQLEERIKNQILNHHKHAQQLEKAIKNQEVHIQNYKEEVHQKEIHILNLEKHILNLEKKISGQKVHLQNYKREVKEQKSLIQNLREELSRQNEELSQQKKEIYDKEVHIRNIENNMNMILRSKVWRTADFFRRVFYMKILKIFPPLQKSMLTITREGFPSFWQKAKKDSS